MLGQSRSTQQHQSHRPNNGPRLLGKMGAVAGERPRFGAERIHLQLPERDWHVNHNRVRHL